MSHLATIPSAICPDSTPQPTIYFIGGNPLAARYVSQLLGEVAQICPLAVDPGAESVSGMMGPVFIIDNCCLLPPLGECLRQLEPCYPEGRYIVIDGHGTEVDAIQMLALGVHGILKDTQLDRIGEAVRAVWEGRIWVEDATLQRYVKSTTARNDIDVPTRRECQVLELARERFSNKEMSQMLGVQESTIKFHLSNIYSKLQIANRLQLQPTDRRSRCWSFHPEVPAS